MEEPLRSAETASHVETIEALKALATNRDFSTDMRSLSHRVLDTPVYMTIDVTVVTSGFDKYRRCMAAEREEASRKRAARADKQRLDKEPAEQQAEEAAQPQQQPRQPRKSQCQVEQRQEATGCLPASG
eukprot:jgi/Tetstr1/466009/TSEL_010600.t1